MQPTDNIVFTYEQVQALGDKIKSGGSTQGYWGDLTYYSEWTIEWSEESADECTINSIDGDKLDAFIAEYGREGENDRANFDYEEGNWQFWGEEGRIEIPAAEMLSRTGIDVTVNDGSSWAYIGLRKGITVDTESETTTISLTNPQFYALAGSGNIFDINNGIPRSAVSDFSFTGSNWALSKIPSGFLSNCANLRTITINPNGSFIDEVLDNFASYCYSLTTVQVPTTVRRIGDSFLNGDTSLTSLTSSLSKLEEIGSSFLQGCTAYNGYLALNGARRIGDSFMAGCTSFNSQLSLTKAEEIGNNFMAGCTAWNYSAYMYSIFGRGANTVQKIGDYFMNNCSALTSFVSVKSGSAFDVDVVGDGFMQGCTSMAGIINFYFKKIGANFLRDCRAVTGVFLDDCFSLGENAFYNCKAMTSLDFKDSCTFMGGLSGKNLCYNCDSLTQVRLYTLTNARVSGINSLSFLTENAEAPAYLNGIRLYHDRSNDINAYLSYAFWKSSLAESDVSPYRKIIFDMSENRNVIQTQNTVSGPTALVDWDASYLVIPGLSTLIDAAGKVFLITSYPYFNTEQQSVVDVRFLKN